MSKAFRGFLFLMVCIYTHVSWAQPANQMVAVSNTVESTSNHLLWKIEGNGIQPSYLFGTIHILPQKDFELKEKVKNAFQASEQIVLELDMDDPNLQVEMMQHSGMKNGQTLESLMKAEDHKKLDETLKALVGMGAQVVNGMKPFIVYSMILPSLIDGPMASFEQTFVAMAQQQQKELLGLETATEQLQVFDRIPYQNQVDDLNELLNQQEDLKALFAKMVEYYKAEDYQQLYKYTRDYIDHPKELDLMLGERNRKWIPRIGDLAKEKPTFFGVGAAHLGGEEGVLALLKKAGYRVTAVAQ